ncbi:MAG: hypothetical protein AMXMBFR4_19330 [Candidatus Hydrogenedentota bacterium]
MEILQQPHTAREIGWNDRSWKTGDRRVCFVGLYRYRALTYHLFASLVRLKWLLHSIYPKWRQQDPSKEVLLVQRTKVRKPLTNRTVSFTIKELCPDG